MRSEFLPFSPPHLGEEEINEVVAAMRSGWISRGPRTARFEEAFAQLVGAPGALGLNSCTAGLHLALKVLNVGPGDEVICPTMTFASTVNVVEHVGAKPVLVDVEEETLNLDPDRVRAAITDSTRAIMVVHYGGHPAELDALQQLADEAGIALVEDAAHALPARYRGRSVGSSANLTAFSFYATKNLTTGEGGMLTGDAELLDRARILSNHGMTGTAWDRDSDKGGWFYEVVEPGFKYNMTDIKAAMGLRQIDRLAEMQSRRVEVAARYTESLGGLPVDCPGARSHVESAWHLYPIRLRLGELTMGRDDFIREMTDRRIATSVHFIPVHLHPYYRDKYGFVEGLFPVAEDAFNRLVSLPLHPGLSEADVCDVVDAVAEVLSL